MNITRRELKEMIMECMYDMFQESGDGELRKPKSFKELVEEAGLTEADCKRPLVAFNVKINRTYYENNDSAYETAKMAVEEIGKRGGDTSEIVENYNNSIEKLEKEVLDNLKKVKNNFCK